VWNVSLVEDGFQVLPLHVQPLDVVKEVSVFQGQTRQWQVDRPANMVRVEVLTGSQVKSSGFRAISLVCGAGRLVA
jgi:hypothetical protein